MLVEHITIFLFEAILCLQLKTLTKSTFADTSEGRMNGSSNFHTIIWKGQIVDL